MLLDYSQMYATKAASTCEHVDAVCETWLDLVGRRLEEEGAVPEEQARTLELSRALKIRDSVHECRAALDEIPDIVKNLFLWGDAAMERERMKLHVRYAYIAAGILHCRIEEYACELLEIVSSIDPLPEMLADLEEAVQGLPMEEEVPDRLLVLCEVVRSAVEM